MGQIGIALDLGTSGFRGQAIDLENNGIIATVLTARHPLPGANVMDHLNFALESGRETAHGLVIGTVNQVIAGLNIPLDSIKRLAVCGNPIQLSLFEGIEIRDLAFAGERKKKLLGIEPPNRDAKILPAANIAGLRLPAGVEVLIPGAVKHEIGADALAMMVKSNLPASEEIALVTDYGTNAEMALKVGDKIITGSCAAGPALEGQHIDFGMLAAPGAVHDLTAEKAGYRCLVLDNDMMSVSGRLVDLTAPADLDQAGVPAAGITGTGVISIIYEGMTANLIQLPRIKTPGQKLHLGKKVAFSEHDIVEAGKAIGAIRAGFITLAQEAGIGLGDITTAYMAGASGTYVNAWKALQVGLVPPGVQKIYQIGNTSLSMARDMVVDPEKIWELQRLARQLRANHCMFGESRVFERAYLLELSLWGEGMPWHQYHRFSKMYKLPELIEPNPSPEINRLYDRDIPDLGRQGVTYIDRVGYPCRVAFTGCTGCGTCIDGCPEKALSLFEGSGAVLSIRPDRCNGTACKRCEINCPEKVFKFNLISFVTL
ncbi:methylamine methyltransferase corrinoid protein reductive activase [Desulfotomaculum arcticum]|uniref:Methylamine methyltransferase corrinoid protein reductive activase n=1 Tax=Desulfotruncus arcticus DSM 17038 TaxID=1121424 RepID=A0A1I2WSC5_9FIRM|nr:methylamine methyltransferase corrinoid protein reductive activase [Desulfotruncus arcticus]SFH04268.1 methylamine methyltransferase corrinoid protein reductive activase [Desulfotomaculum arcticum] [Desulfotruncus arcticus DSM 17038]